MTRISVEEEPKIKPFIEPVEPGKITISGVVVKNRLVRHDPRGGLLVFYDGMAGGKEACPNKYDYASYTRPGEARDPDRFHVHQHQLDRFTVVMGRLWVLLLDMRKESSTFGRLQVVEMNGIDTTIDEKADKLNYTITIPMGVYHGIMAPGPKGALLINAPTREYDPKDEGRIPFDQVDIPNIGHFSWDKVVNS